MAEPNKLLIEKDGGGVPMRVRCTNAEGVVKDITASFREITGSTSPAGFTNAIKIQVGSSQMEIEFTAISKKLDYQLDPETARSLFYSSE